MDIQSFINFKVEFDLRAYPTLVISGAGELDAEVGPVTFYATVKQPNGISIPYGSPTSGIELPLPVPLRLTSAQEHQCGSYEITLYSVTAGGLHSKKRAFEFTYTPVKVQAGRTVLSKT